jgi:hypothetical protein
MKTALDSIRSSPSKWQDLLVLAAVLLTWLSVAGLCLLPR